MSVRDEVLAERARQNAKWGEQNHDLDKWLLILTEELGEVARAWLDGDRAHARKEMVQVAAVLLAIVDCGERNRWWVPGTQETLIVDRVSGFELWFTQLLFRLSQAIVDREWTRMLRRNLMQALLTAEQILAGMWWPQPEPAPENPEQDGC